MGTKKKKKLSGKKNTKKTKNKNNCLAKKKKKKKKKKWAHSLPLVENCGWIIPKASSTSDECFLLNPNNERL